MPQSWSDDRVENRMEARAKTKKVYRISLVVLADRTAGHSGPSAGSKPWGDVLRLPASTDWLVNLRDRVLENYSGRGSLVKRTRPKIIYLERQSTGRSLVEEDHETLMDALYEREKEGLADVQVVTFAGAVPVEDQVATIVSSSNSTISA